MYWMLTVGGRVVEQPSVVSDADVLWWCVSGRDCPFGPRQGPRPRCLVPGPSLQHQPPHPRHCCYCCCCSCPAGQVASPHHHHQYRFLQLRASHCGGRHTPSDLVPACSADAPHPASDWENLQTQLTDTLPFLLAPCPPPPSPHPLHWARARYHATPPGVRGRRLPYCLLWDTVHCGGGKEGGRWERQRLARVTAVQAGLWGALWGRLLDCGWGTCSTCGCGDLLVLAPLHRIAQADEQPQG
eukprot:scaffold118716_cov19-Tisochrysis_lutea.AAC.1